MMRMYNVRGALHMPMTDLGGGTVLEYGTVTNQLIAEVSRVAIDRVRVSDLEELIDFLYELGYGPEEISGDFGMLLALSLGLGREGTRHYTIRHNGRLVFVATLSRPQTDRVCMMCGFGMKDGYKWLSRRDIATAAATMFSWLVDDLVSIFNARHAVCHVKSNNTQTLAMWKWFARIGASINITDNPFFRKSYKLVTLEVPVPTL